MVLLFDLFAAGRRDAEIGRQRLNVSVVGAWICRDSGGCWDRVANRIGRVARMGGEEVPRRRGC